jgi:glucosamine--fructose-6-phosphate aminotransferase (isomerizing)
MPVVALAPSDHVYEKMLGNIQEAKTRGGSVIALVTDGDTDVRSIVDLQRDSVIALPQAHPLVTPILMVVPLQLLAYHVAIRRGCDVDQPRNLAKSVTVE